MDKKIVHSDDAPAAIGPYSQAIISNGFLFAAGQIPLDPKTMKIVDGGIEEQCKRVLENIKAVLASESLNFNNVVKTTIFLKDLDDFQAVNGIYTEYFGEAKPARSTIQVAKLPLDSMVEIEIVARVE